MVGAESVSWVRASASAAAEARMASAAAWSVEVGGGGPMVCQVDFLVRRNSAVEAFTGWRRQGQ